MTDSMESVFDVIAMDITSFCNLRCPFCLSSHTLPKVFMSEDVFDKAISLIPLAKSTNFMFSCLYEPTLHPSFLEYVKRIPQEQRTKVFFTTNLAKRISDEIFEELSVSGLHHINISVDSLEPSLYEKLRKGAHFSVFHDNLTRMVEIFSQKENAPALHYISVVNKLNYKEIPSVIEQCFTKYLAHIQDIREYWLLSHQRELEWCIQHKLSALELGALKQSVSGLPYDFNISEAGRDLGNLVPGADSSGEDIIDQAGWRNNLYHSSCTGPEIRIQADGMVEVLGRNVHFYLQDIESPVSFMSDFASFLKLDLEKTAELQKVAGMLIHNTLHVRLGHNVQGTIDETIYTPKTLIFRGWAFHEDGNQLGVVVQIPNMQEVCLEYEPQESPDVGAMYGAPASKCRFELKLHLNYSLSPEELTGIQLEISDEKCKFFKEDTMSLRKKIRKISKLFC